MSKLAAQVPGFDTDRYDKIEFEPDSAEIRMLEERYAPLKFKLSVNLQPPFRLLQPEQQDADIVEIAFTVRGPIEDLIRFRFAHSSWRRLPPCGVGRFNTEGFGRAHQVRLNKSGDYSLSYLDLDHALDLLAPLFSLHWMPPAKRHVT